VVAASDYVRAVPSMIAGAIDARFVALGTDGFGRSDTRQALRRFFEVDRHQVALAALHVLACNARLPRSTCTQALQRYGIDADAPAPWTV
jgi:pyruvate dehydrogenase E1 component